MSPRADALDALRSATLVGVVRARTEARARAVVSGLLDGGFRALEVTADTPGCLGLIAELSRRVRDVTLGVGTVMDIETLAGARAAGARFVVSPHTDPALIEATVAAGLVSIPGAFTATEIVRARGAGADFVKLFPVSAGGGPRMLRVMRGPMPQVPFWVSGDVAISEIGAYLDAGAQLVGLTSAIGGDMEHAADTEVPRLVAERALACLTAASEARDGRVILDIEREELRLEVDLRTVRRRPGPEHVALESVVPGRRGHAIRLRGLLERVGARDDERAELISQDGFAREVPARQLMEAGLLQFGIDGRPLEPHEGGPVRLYLADGTDRCDNVKALRRIRLLPAI